MQANVDWKKEELANEQICKCENVDSRTHRRECENEDPIR